MKRDGIGNEFSVVVEKIFPFLFYACIVVKQEKRKAERKTVARWQRWFIEGKRGEGGEKKS